MKFVFVKKIRCLFHCSVTLRYFFLFEAIQNNFEHYRELICNWKCFWSSEVVLNQLFSNSFERVFVFHSHWNENFFISENFEVYFY